MTTIAYRDKTMCSDSQATRGDFIDNLSTTKIFEVGDGILIGISGSALDALEFVEWFKDTLEASNVQEQNPYVSVLPPEKLVNENFHCLVAYPDDTVYEFFGCEKVMECAESYAAVGSGMFYAMSAMDAGASAEEAVCVAIKRDVFSGGDIQVFQCEEAPEPIDEETIKAMSKEELLKLILPDIDVEVEGSVAPEDCEVVCDKEDVVQPAFHIVDPYHPEVIIHLDALWYDGAKMLAGNDSMQSINVTTRHLRVIAKLLDIDFAYNIGNKKLAARVDGKIAEIRKTLVD